MPPAAKRNVAVIMYDLKGAFSTESKNLLYKLFGYKWLQSSKDVVTIYAFNANQTRNQMRPPCEGVYLSNSLVQYNPEYLNELFASVKPDESTSKSNWLEALYVAADYLDRLEDTKGVITRQLILMTDLMTPGLGNHNKIEQIITILNSNDDIYFHVIGPEVKYSSPLLSRSELDFCKESMKFLNPNGNTEILQQILSETKHSLVSDFKTGYHLFTLHSKSAGTQPWYAPLNGKLIEFPQASRRVLNRTTEIKIVEDENDSPKKFSWVNAENINIEVDFSKVVRGISRHGKFVPFDYETKKTIKYKCERCFEILGFTEEHVIPEYYFVGDGSYMVTADERDEDNYNDINILIDCLISQKKYLIAKKVYSASSKPKFHCLIPRAEPNMKYFIMTELPFAENIKVDYFEEEIDMEAVEQAEQSPELQEFLDSLDIDSSKSQINFPLHVNLLHKIREEAIIDKTLEKVCDQYSSSGSEILKLDLPEKLKTKMCEIFPKMPLEEENDDADQEEESDFEFEEGDLQI